MKPSYLLPFAFSLLATGVLAQPKPPLPGMPSGKTAPAAAIKPVVAPAAATGKLTPIADGATVLSADGKLIWMRCHIGQNFEKGQCVGEPKKMDQRDAENEVKRMNLTTGFAGNKDWRLPTIVELQSLVFCEQGFGNRRSTIKLAAAQSAELPDSCQGDSYLRPTIDPIVFPNANKDWVWSATPDQDRVINVWALNFASGSPAPVGRHNSQTAVRAVRFAK
jgi:hypothetical protein